MTACRTQRRSDIEFIPRQKRQRILRGNGADRFQPLPLEILPDIAGVAGKYVHVECCEIFERALLALVGFLLQPLDLFLRFLIRSQAVAGLLFGILACGIGIDFGNGSITRKPIAFQIQLCLILGYVVFLDELLDRRTF